MLRTSLISGAAIAALAIAGAAYAQGSSGSGASSNPGASSTSPAPNAGPKANGATSGGERAQERTGTSGSSTTTSQSKPGANGSSVTTGQSDSRGSSHDNLTTGLTPKVQISEQQRTQLRTRFKQANLRTVSRDQVNVAIAVGAVLPSTVTFAPIPDPILAIVPEFRGYDAVRVGDQILIIEPGTRRIVYIIEA